MATLTVTTNADSGTGSLRQAIADATSGDTIVFDSTVFPAGQTTAIPLASTLTVSKSLTIDAGTPVKSGSGANLQLTCRVALDGQESIRVAFTTGSNTQIVWHGVCFQRGKYLPGGGLYTYLSSQNDLTDCVFSHNSTGNSTTGNGGGLYSDSDSQNTLTGCVFSGNTANYGGGLRSDSSSQNTLTDCVFIGNAATGYGGGLHSSSYSQNTLTGCVFSGNTANYGGDIYITAVAKKPILNLNNGNVVSSSLCTRGDDATHTPTINFSGYNGVGGYGVYGTAPTISGSGFLALPSSASITLPNTITRTVYGAGVSNLTSNNLTLSWSSTDSTKSVLLEKQNGANWDVVSTSATSPTTVSSVGTYRIWDGETFLTCSSPPQTLVVTNTNDSGVGSLRAALASARAVDTVTFDASLSGSTITLASGLTLTDAVEIVGLVDNNGDPAITISGANTYRILSGNYQMTLSNLIFANAGNNAIYNEDANGSTFTNCVFSNNSATDSYGGAVLLEGVNAATDSASFTDCVFSGNSSLKTMILGWGGALTTNKLNVTATGCTFTNNTAQGEYGGAVAFYTPSCTLTLSNCSFTGNSIATRAASTGDMDHGGAVYSAGSLVASGCTFTNNAVANQYDGDGGGAVSLSSSGLFSNCAFSGNSAKIHGGAVEASLGSSPSFSNCSFSGNSTTYDTEQSGKDASQGGAIYSEASVSCTSCTFTNNTTAGFGSSIAIDDHGATLTSCTFSGGSSTTFDVFVVSDSSTASLSLMGGNNLPAGVATYSYNSRSAGITNTGYNGVGAYDEKSGSASTFSGSGFLALPPSTVVSFPATLTQTEYGAGISNFSAGEDSLSWSSVDSTRTVLLEKQNGGSWDTIDVDATSPASVSQTGVYRIWDGASFLSTSIRFPIVVTNTNDSGAGSLRAAINSATADDTITFDASLEGGTIHLLSGLSATNGATIIGLVDNDGNPAITIDGSPDVEILTSNLPVVVSNINFENGNIAFWTGDAGVDGSSFTNCTFSGFVMNALEITISGGGSLASVELTDCVFTENGSGAYAYAVTVFSGVDLTLENCDFHDNDVTAVWSIDDVDIALAGGNVIDEGISFKDAGTANLALTGYNGVGAYTVPDAGTVTATGTGFLALPDDAVLTLPGTVTRSEFGAGISDLKNSDLVLTWSSVDDNKTVLLQVADDDDWDTVSTSASSPETVNDEGVYRIWDGRVFLTVSALKTVYWLVKGWATETHGGGSSSLNWTVTNISVDPNLGGLE